MKARIFTDETDETDDAAVTGSARLLVVGEDAHMVDLLCATLRFAGYRVRTASPGGEAVAVAESWSPGLMLQDGFKVTRFQAGRRRAAPAIFLTPGDQLLGRLPGLTVGGGDYVTKPFSPEELLARVRSVLRRTRCAPGDGVLRIADLELAEDTYEVRRAGQLIRLTPTEFQLLRYFMHNAGEVLTRTQILDHVWPYGYTGDQKVVETYVFRLRQRVETREPKLIHTLRGVGYTLRPPRG